MGKRGPKPKDKSSSTPLPGKPSPPKELDAVAKAHWKEVVALVEESGLLSLMDRDALTLYCVLWSTWLEAEKMAKLEGKVITSPNGYQQKNPWYDISNQCLKDMKTFFTMFGLSPAARERLTFAEPEEVDTRWSQFDAG